MMDNSKGKYIFLHLTAILGFAGFMSMAVHQQSSDFYSLVWPTSFLIVVLYLTQYLLLRFFKKNNLIFNIVALLTVLGWLILLRLEPPLVYKQLMWIILGCSVLIISIQFLKIISSDFILKYKTYWLFLTILFLALPLLIGIEAGGAKSWLQVGNWRIQPSEAAKLSFLVFLASWFKEKRINKLTDTWLVWLSTFICLGILVLQRDLGTALIFYLTFLVLLYSATGKSSGPILGLIIFMIGAVFAYSYFPHVKIRAMAWLNPWLEPDRGGYQILQSLFALSSGGIFGMGLGAGNPQVIPEAHTDFVFAVIGEQLGILGTTGVILLYLLFTYFTLSAAQVIPTSGSRILASGISFLFIVQAFIIIGGVTKFIPLTGLPLPFMSYGGSSTLSNFAMLGILLWLTKERGLIPLIYSKRLFRLNKLIWLVFLALIINISFWQVVKAQSMIEHPLNPRWRLVEQVTERGTIFAADGSILATNNDSQLGRMYPLKEAAAHLVGYNSSMYGKTGLENSLNKELLAISQIRPGFLQDNREGWHAYTTIEPKLQRLAYNLLKEQSGAAVVLNIKNGNILALVSTPAFDPNSILNQWSMLQNSEAGNLFNRATQGTYPPGSVFKIITGTVLLQQKPQLIKLSTELPEFINVNGYRISDLVYRSKLSFPEAIGYSSNVYFVKHFLSLDWEKIKLVLENNFLEKSISTRYLPIKNAALGQVIDKADFAATVIGQGEVLVTPLHMAIWTGAIANEGLMLKPRIIDKIVSFDNKLISKNNPEVIGTVCSKEEAQEVLKGLQYTVERGTGIMAKIPGVKIGGKTGSAENIHGKPHAWFVGVAPISNPQVVVVTLIEHGGRGGEAAAPIARALIEESLETVKTE